MISDIFLTMNLTVIKNSRINQLSQLKRCHILDIKLLVLSRRTDPNRVINLRNSFDKILYFSINQILTFSNSHKPVDWAMISFHELNVIIFVFEQIRFKLSWNTLLWNYIWLKLAAFVVDFSQKVFYIWPSLSINTFYKLSSLTTLFMLNVQIEKSIL